MSEFLMAIAMLCQVNPNTGADYDNLREWQIRCQQRLITCADKLNKEYKDEHGVNLGVDFHLVDCAKQGAHK